MRTDLDTPPGDSPEIGSGVIVLGRLMWMILGPFFSLLICLAIATSEGWTTAWHISFPLLVVLMIGGRWVEQRSGQATTATGEPATSEHFRRYVRVLVPVAAGVWLAASVVGNHIVT